MADDKTTVQERIIRDESLDEKDRMRRDPDVIDIEPERDDAVSEPVSPAFTRDAETVKDISRKPRTWPLLAAAATVGLLAGGWLYRDVLQRFFPNDQIAALSQRVETLQANTTTAQGKLDSLTTALNSGLASVEKARAQLEADVQGLAETTGTNSQKQLAVEKSLAAVSASLAELKTRVDGLGNVAPTQGSVDASGLASLAARVDELRKDVDALKSQKSVAADTTALSQTLSDLKAKVAQGVSFSNELDRIQRMVPAAEGLDVLSRHAAGLPNAQGLAAELKAAVTTLPAESATTSTTAEDGYWARITGFFSRLITIRDSGQKDWRSFAETLVATAQSGDLSDALAAIDAIDGSKPGAIEQFRERAAARLQLEEAVSKTSESVMREIAAKAATP